MNAIPTRRGGTTTPTALVAVVALPALAAFSALAATAGHLDRVVAEHGTAVAVFAAATLVLQAASFSVFGSSISVSGLGMLAVGFTFGTGPGMAVAFLAAFVHVLRKRPRLHKAVFNCACFTLATGAASGLYHLLGGATASVQERLGLAVASSCVFVAINTGLLSLAIAVAERLPVIPTWKSRLRWLSPVYLSFGPLALLIATIETRLGLLSLIVLASAAALATMALRLSLDYARRQARTRGSLTGSRRWSC